jgi:hypothetical protein
MMDLWNIINDDDDASSTQPFEMSTRIFLGVKTAGA